MVGLYQYTVKFPNMENLKYGRKKTVLSADVLASFVL